jgi:hypothetical protein
MQLPDDVREFTKLENPQPEEFYCLQPLALRPNVMKPTRSLGD